MKSLSLFVSLTILANCKAHQGGEEPHSDTEALVSESGQILSVALSSDSTKKEQRYCVLWTSLEGDEQKTKLLTPIGGIREGQLRRALRLLDFEEQFFSLFVPAGVAGAMTGSAVAAGVYIGGAVAGGAALVIAATAAVTWDVVLGRKRAKAIKDDEKVVEISDRVMARSIRRVQKEKSDRVGTCNHLENFRIDIEKLKEEQEG